MTNVTVESPTPQYASIFSLIYTSTVESPCLQNLTFDCVIRGRVRRKRKQKADQNHSTDCPGGIGQTASLIGCVKLEPALQSVVRDEDVVGT
jgi:hypothetical protein